MRSIFFIGILKYNNFIKQFKFNDKITGGGGWQSSITTSRESFSPAELLTTPTVHSQSKMWIRVWWIQQKCILLEQRTAWHLEQKSFAFPATLQKWFLVLMGRTFSWIDPPFHRTNYRFINIYGALVTADSSCLRTLSLISLPPGRGIWSQL